MEVTRALPTVLFGGVKEPRAGVSQVVLGIVFKHAGLDATLLGAGNVGTVVTRIDVTGRRRDTSPLASVSEVPEGDAGGLAIEGIVGEFGGVLPLAGPLVLG